MPMGLTGSYGTEMSMTSIDEFFVTKVSVALRFDGLLWDFISNRSLLLMLRDGSVI
jgi:hypothetical protein